MKLLIGGGDLLAKYAKYKKTSNEIRIITSNRMLNEKLMTNKTLAEELKGLNIDFVEAKNLDEEKVIELMLESEIAISFASPWIFKQTHIENCKKIVNIHLTELPKWKGAGSISWKILCDERRGGSTIHELTNEIDEGKLLYQKKYKLPNDIRLPKDIYKFTIEQAAETIFKALDEISNCDKTKKCLNSKDDGFYFPRLNTEPKCSN